MANLHPRLDLNGFAAVPLLVREVREVTPRQKR